MAVGSFATVALCVVLTDASTIMTNTGLSGICDHFAELKKQTEKKMLKFIAAVADIAAFSSILFT